MCVHCGIELYEINFFIQSSLSPGFLSHRPFDMSDIFPVLNLTTPRLSLRRGINHLTLPAVLEFLDSKPQLVSIDFSQNSSLQSSELCALIERLREITTLHTIVTDDNRFENGAAAVQALFSMRNVRQIFIECSWIEDREMLAIAETIFTNGALLSLNKLKFGGNLYSDQGVIALAGALRCLTTLTSLSFKRNVTCAETGGRALCSLVETSSCIRSFTMPSSCTGVEAALATLVERNTTIQKLRVDLRQMRLCYEALASHASLRSLVIYSSERKHSDFDVKRIVELLRVNNSLTKVFRVIDLFVSDRLFALL